MPKFVPKNKREERAERLVSKNVGVIISEGERLTALINNVLDITKMESGTIDWKYEKTTMLVILEQSISATQGLFENKEITLKTNFDDADIEVVADKDRLVQVLLNLISNAVKFTPQGHIEIGLTKREGNILVYVKDSGVGMTKESSKKIFEKYHQVSENAHKGTGLGLPISKEIIEGHGGEIWAESERGKGSTFFFTVPLPRSFVPNVRTANQKQLLDQLKSLSTNSQRIQQVLIVDDESSIRQLVSQSLEPGGYQLREAQNGLEALDFIRKHMPDLIISDVMMPKMNGFDLVAVLKNDIQFMHIPIIMLTVIPDEQRGYGLGVDTYLRKPISPDKIREEVDSLFQRLSTEKSVLIIGKNAKRISALRKKVSALHYIVHHVESVQELRQVKGKKLTMVIVEEEFISAAELQHSLTSIGQSTALIRMWKV